MNCSRNLPAYPTTASSRIPGMSPAALAGFVDSIGAAGAGVRKAELAMSLPLSRELPGNGFQQAETDEQRCGKRQQHRPGVEGNAVKERWFGHMWITPVGSRQSLRIWGELQRGRN